VNGARRLYARVNSLRRWLERAGEREAAAAYLDGRMVWWMGWEVAARDHKTFCVTCPTVVPCAMARGALRMNPGAVPLRVAV
jgi:hypothetical protein